MYKGATLTRDKLLKLLLLGLIGIQSFSYMPQKAKADVYDDFLSSGQSNYVIKDDDFIDVNSMSVQQIQDFLAGYGSYLAFYTDPDGRTAAQIIYDSAHANYRYLSNGILYDVDIQAGTGTVNPKVILVYLQKEQSLISRTTRDEWAMLASLGYQCFAGVSGDSNGNNCKDTTEGFAKQIEYGAWQLRYNYEIAAKDDTWWCAHYANHYQSGTPITTSDGHVVYLNNRATASAYRYTPYVFYSAFNVWNIFYNTYAFGTSPAPVITPGTPPPVTPPRKTGDANSDGSVGIADLSLLGDTWGQNVTANTGADFNSDGVVNIADLSILGDNWGQ